MQKQLQNDCEVACIGPAGERLVKLANSMVGSANSVGRGGMGALLGAKNLKAIVVDGSQKPAVADQELFQKAFDDIMRLLRASPVVMGELGLGEFGTCSLVDIVEQRRLAPTENFRKTWYPQAHLYSGPALKKAFGMKKHGCAVCPFQCKKTTTCGKPSPEYETLSHFGALNANPSSGGDAKASGAGADSTGRNACSVRRPTARVETKGKQMKTCCELCEAVFSKPTQGRADQALRLHMLRKHGKKLPGLNGARKPSAKRRKRQDQAGPVVRYCSCCGLDLLALSVAVKTVNTMNQ